MCGYLQHYRDASRDPGCLFQNSVFCLSNLYLAYFINIHGENNCRTLHSGSKLVPFEICTFLPGKYIFLSGLRNPKSYLPEKVVFHQFKLFSASRRAFLVLGVIQQRCLCLVFVLPLLASDVPELSSEPLHFSIPSLSRTSSARWIWSALLPECCSGWSWRGFLHPRCLPGFFQIKQGWASPSGGRVKPLPFIYAHTPFSWMR